MIGEPSCEDPVRPLSPRSGRLIELVVMVGVWVRRVVLVVGLAWAGLLAGAAGALAQPAFTPVAGSPFATGVGPASVAFSPSGELLATANSTDGTVSVFSVAADGALTAVGTPVSTRPASRSRWSSARPGHCSPPPTPAPARCRCFRSPPAAR